MSDSLGVDVGGTKIQFCLVDGGYGVSRLQKVPTALMRRGTVAFAADLAELVRSVKPARSDRIGVSLNGVIDRGTVVYSSLMGGKVDFPLESYLAESLSCSVHVDDDIHAMTLAEAVLGVGRSAGSFAMLNIGTGIGVGCYDGHVLRGRYAAGLIAEIEVFVEEVASYRSLDTTVCGRGIRELLGELTGSPQDAVTVFRRAADGDERARTVIDIFSRYLGYTFGLISSFYHPEVIVINGSIKHAAPFYLERAIAEYRSKVGAPFLAQVELSGVEHAAERGTLIPEGGYGAG